MSGIRLGILYYGIEKLGDGIKLVAETRIDYASLDS